MSERCGVKKCGAPAEYIFYGHGVCDKHWRYHCEGKLSLKKVFRIKDIIEECKDERDNRTRTD